MSLATEPQPGRELEQIQERFATYDELHAELLTWLERNGFGSTPQDRIPAAVLERARRELGHPAPPPAPVVKTFVAERKGPSPTPVVAAPAEPPDRPALSVRPHSITTSDVVQASAHEASAKEARMAEKTCSKCGKDLRADNSTGACGDRAACAARAAGKGAKLKPPMTGAAKPKRIATVAGDLVVMSINELVAERDAAKERVAEIGEELQRRKDAIDEALGFGVGSSGSGKAA